MFAPDREVHRRALVTPFFRPDARGAHCPALASGTLSRAWCQAFHPRQSTLRLTEHKQTRFIRQHRGQRHLRRVTMLAFVCQHPGQHHHASESCNGECKEVSMNNLTTKV
ncbi:hypothetical protein UPYG_G00260170 [Umbra pygmaea]|uniref:Uncharacterized protein n=1 Tax=Umbra pygmaea TaxID=75934 RepID=A0ABD0WDG9_UMBPY